MNTCAGCSLFKRVSGFILEPINSAATNTSWVLFVGLVLIVAYLWTRVLRDIQSML